MPCAFSQCLVHIANLTLRLSSGMTFLYYCKVFIFFGSHSKINIFCMFEVSILLFLLMFVRFEVVWRKLQIEPRECRQTRPILMIFNSVFCLSFIMLKVFVLMTSPMHSVCYCFQVLHVFFAHSKSSFWRVIGPVKFDV